MGQGARVDSRNWAILILDVGGKFGVPGVLVMSVHLPAAMTVVTALSLGRSVSATTAVGPALLLLWLGSLLLLLGELGIRLLAPYSTKLVGLRGLATAARSAFLLERESSCLDDSIWLQGLDFAR